MKLSDLIRDMLGLRRRRADRLWRSPDVSACGSDRRRLLLLGGAWLSARSG
jgi:hypothetical protein